MADAEKEVSVERDEHDEHDELDPLDEISGFSAAETLWKLCGNLRLL